MTRLSFLAHGGYLVNTLDLLLIKVLVTYPGCALGSMAYLRILSYIMLTALHTPTVIWYQ